MVTDTAARKELGAYYTAQPIAAFLVRWAIRTSQDTVLDPSCGEGVFLHAAAQRIAELGGQPRQQLTGVDIDADAHQVALTAGNVLHASFFDILPGAIPPCDAVVGNPPFIRYQRFAGAIREESQRRAQEAGVELSGLSSSWAPFLVHSIRFIRAGGRLAVVAPAELLHAAYARPVVEHLRASFARVQVVTFAHKLFPDLSEDTVLVLASGRGEEHLSFSSLDLPGPAALGQYPDPANQLPLGTPINTAAIVQGQERHLYYLLPGGTGDLYRALRTLLTVRRLGALADIGIGYVTGHNGFFHLTRAEATERGLPSRFLHRAVRSGADLVGLRFTTRDWKRLSRAGQDNLLLHVPFNSRLPQAIQQYIEEGCQLGVHMRYKCRNRPAWYSVPHVYVPDGFLTYMSGERPKMSANDASAVASNALHIVRMHSPSEIPHGALGLAALWQTSLTALSCEVEGHSLGGGMLKMEPTEAERVAIALPSMRPDTMAELAADLDWLLRADRVEEARDLADTRVLHDAMGLSAREVARLREGANLLRARRTKR